MKTQKTNMHFTDNYLIAPGNPITVNLIGAGGTGSQVLTALARMNHALTALNHAGLMVRLWDDDRVSQANLGRQIFAESELGLHKSVALINRTNRFFGTDWKAENARFVKGNPDGLAESTPSNIYISCIDTVDARFEIATILKGLQTSGNYRNQPKYWMDFGNSQHTGQVILSTFGNIRQPSSDKYSTVNNLPFITDEYGQLLRQSEIGDDTPSCSLADALEKQDLFTNSTLAQTGCSLLWNLFRNGCTAYKGFFLNLKDFRSQPIPV